VEVDLIIDPHNAVYQRGSAWHRRAGLFSVRRRSRTSLPSSGVDAGLGGADATFRLRRRSFVGSHGMPAGAHYEPSGKSPPPRARLVIRAGSPRTCIRTREAGPDRRRAFSRVRRRSRTSLPSGTSGPDSGRPLVAGRFSLVSRHNAASRRGLRVLVAQPKDRTSGAVRPSERGPSKRG